MAATCDFCDLPLPASPPGLDVPRFCCYGCRFAAEVTGARGAEGAVSWALVRLGLSIFFAMNVMVFTMVLWSREVYGQAAEEAALAGSLHGFFRCLCLLFALPVLVLLGGTLLESSLAQLRQKQFNTDLLLLTGVAASYLYSAHSVLRDEGPIYFEVGCMVLVFVTLGRWLEASGKLRANRALESLQKLLPDQVRVVEATGVVVRALSRVTTGDRLHVLAGERIPCDGRVLEHAVHVDEQILSGESLTLAKEPGDIVYAGTLNVDSDLLLDVTSGPEAGTLQRLVRLVREARLRKGAHERLADRIARWFLLLVMLIAVSTLCLQAAMNGLDQGILSALAVLVIACPCALGIATPLAVWVALGEAARRQVVVQSGDVLERLASLSCLCFDKTGTLTTGTASVEKFVTADGAAVLQHATRLSRASHHSLACAIRSYAAAGDTDSTPGSVTTLPGRGLVGTAEGDEVFLGSLRLMEERGLNVGAILRDELDDSARRAAPVVCVGWKGQVRGVFVFREQLRPEANVAIARLRKMGLVVTVLTGDHAARGQALANELGVGVEAALLPEDKLAALVRLRTAGGPVAMIGDGINDGPALAASDVGFAMGCGADLARASAGVCLLGDDLTRIPWIIDLGRRTVRVIRQNLFWSLVYNAAGIALACTGHLSPVVAALAMVVSSVLVVGNSLRLRAEA